MALDGSGTQASPWLIKDVDDLVEFSTTSSYWGSGTYTKIDDSVTTLNLSSVSSWTPIGTSSNAYAGTFDGNGKTISNLEMDNVITVSSIESGCGFFGVTSAANIKNLLLESCSITVSSSYSTPTVYGLLISYDYGSIIDNVYLYECTITVTNSYSDKTQNVGGLIGSIQLSSLDTTITNSIIDCDISGTTTRWSNVGGIIGTSYSKVIIEDTYFIGTLYSSGSDKGNRVSSGNGALISDYDVSGFVSLSKSYSYGDGSTNNGGRIYGLLEGSHTITLSNNYALSSTYATYPFTPTSSATGKDGADITSTDVSYTTATSTTPTFWTTTLGYDFADTWYWDKDATWQDKNGNTYYGLPKLQVFRQNTQTLTVSYYTNQDTTAYGCKFNNTKVVNNVTYVGVSTTDGNGHYYYFYPALESIDSTQARDDIDTTSLSGGTWQTVQTVEYLRLSSAYINTGVIPSDNTYEVVTEIKTSITPSASAGFVLFGSNSLNYYGLTRTSVWWLWESGTETELSTTPSWSTSDWNLIDFNNANHYVYSGSNAIDSTSRTYTSSTQIMILSRSGVSGFSGDVRYFYIKDNTKTDTYYWKGEPVSVGGTTYMYDSAGYGLYPVTGTGTPYGTGTDITYTHTVQNAPTIDAIDLDPQDFGMIYSEISGYVNASPSTEGLTLSYQWAYSTNAAVSWTNISEQTSATLSYTPQTAGTYYFKVYVSDSGGATDSYTAGFTNVFVKVLNVYTPGNVSTKTSSIQAKTLETYQATNEFDFGSTILDVKYVDDTTAYVAAGNAIYVVDGTGATISPLTTYTGNTISSVYLGSTRAIINDVDNNVAVYDYTAKTMEYIATNGSSKVAISPNYAYVVNDTGYLNIYNSSNQIVASMQYTYSYLEVNQETDIFGYSITHGSFVDNTGFPRYFNYYTFNDNTITSKRFTCGYEYPLVSDTYSAKAVGDSKYWVIYNSQSSGMFRILDINSAGTASNTVSYSPDKTVQNVHVAETLSSIFNSNSVIYVYGNDATLQGQYSAGGSLNDVSLSYSNGLYAIGAGNDSNAYFINKESSSSWVLGQATNFQATVYHSQMSYDGQMALIGTTNKLFLFKYSESVESTYYINGVVVGSDGLPYANKIITIDATSITTDDSGFFVYPVKPGQTYTIITGSKTTKYTATNQALQTLSIKITSQLVAQDVTYGASYNSTSSNIEMNYNDAADKTSIVVWSVRDTKTGQEVSRQSVSAGTQAYYFVPSNKTSDNYFVTVSATRGNTSVKNTWSITPSGQGQSVNLFGMDDTGKNILFGFFIILLAGLFGYLHQHIGTIIVAFAAAILRYLGLITVPWIMICIAVVVAIVAAIAHRGEGK